MSGEIFAQCRQCLYTANHPFGITFDESGLCSGCKVHQEKDKIDWAERLERLKALIEPFRSKCGNHDCVIHVDGSAESFHVLYLVKQVLKLEPLLVNFNSHFLNDIGVRNLAMLRTEYDCDFIQYSVDLNFYKKLVRESVTKFNHVLWPYIAGKTALPVQIAVKRRIPLVIWGGLQTVEQVGMFSHLDEVEMSRWHRKNHELFGIDEESFVDSGGLVSEDDLECVRYPSDDDLGRVGVRGIYLSNYFRWDPLGQNAKTVAQGFTPEIHGRSFDMYEYAGCSVFLGIHDLSRELRSGYPKVLDQACREIRFKRLDKDTAVKLVNAYSAMAPAGMDEFWSFLGVTTSARSWLEDFVFLKSGPKQHAGFDLRVKQMVEFAANCKSRQASKRFITFGKGLYL